MDMDLKMNNAPELREKSKESATKMDDNTSMVEKPNIIMNSGDAAIGPSASATSSKNSGGMISTQEELSKGDNIDQEMAGDSMTNAPTTSKLRATRRSRNALHIDTVRRPTLPRKCKSKQNEMLKSISVQRAWKRKRMAKSKIVRRNEMSSRQTRRASRIVRRDEVTSRQTRRARLPRSRLRYRRSQPVRRQRSPSSLSSDSLCPRCQQYSTGSFSGLF